MKLSLLSFNESLRCVLAFMKTNKNYGKISLFV